MTEYLGTPVGLDRLLKCPLIELRGRLDVTLLTQNHWIRNFGEADDIFQIVLVLDPDSLNRSLWETCK
jgi:hypothetical protein